MRLISALKEAFRSTVHLALVPLFTFNYLGVLGLRVPRSIAAYNLLTIQPKLTLLFLYSAPIISITDAHLDLPLQ